MSVDAYIVRTDDIYVDRKTNTIYNTYIAGKNLKRYTHKDEEFCFSFWHGQSDFADIVRRYSNDCTNEDSCGEMELHISDFKRMIEDNEFTNEDDLESIEIMKKYFEEGNHEWILFNCY